jgi:hypothetical protein
VTSNTIQITTGGTYEFKVVSYFNCLVGPEDLTLQIQNTTTATTIASVVKTFQNDDYKDVNLLAIAVVNNNDNIRVETVTTSIQLNFNFLYLTITRVA